ncbi:hypothetical protein like AT3G62360 [Hibiscus trionum]|uniref:Carbohydrate-binding-like fold protein n=1 Tax=Hibiscus trionum TaxID=183268 RepID=A0A9W7HEF8_HIBTR|nr:hypothetical protein like AT3G62360 [Hibiscus trionum]
MVATCNNNEDINFRFTGFTLSGRVVGAVGGQRCSVTGFSIGGRVIDANDIGVEGVKILVDGQERSITDKEGCYKLDQVTSNHYTIEAKKEHYKFNKLKDYLVKPNMASVSDIKAVSYDVCGVVRTVDSGYKAKVALTHGPENVKPQVKQTDESGSFCFEVPPGEYRISALSATPESSPELLFLPPYADVVIKSPLYNVDFSQEYAFSPSAQAIELGSGESREVVFHATRVAYSAMGVVTLLSGQPKEGVSIEARSESKGYYEETITDSSGSYRLRGLIPDALYLIKVVKKDGWGSAKIERASPESVPVKVGNNDIKGVDFLVFEEPEMTILSGHVEVNRIGELPSHLLVEIKSAGDTSKIESVFPLLLSNFFQVKDLPRGKHTVQLKSNLPSSIYKFESEIIKVDLEKNSQVHVGPLKYSVEAYHHKQELTPAPVFPLIVGVSVIILFLGIPRFKDFYQAATGIPTPGFMTTAKKEARKPVVRKKTY